MKWNVGDSAQITATVDDDRIRRFAYAVEDLNPIHLDDEAALKSIFGRRVAHGMIAGSFVSAVLGTRLPGPGSILLELDLKFVAPVYVGDDVTAQVTVRGIRDDKPIITLEAVCTTGDGRRVLNGEAVVLFKEPVGGSERGGTSGSRTPGTPGGSVEGGLAKGSTPSGPVGPGTSSERES